jgi:hypothetical protein
MAVRGPPAWMHAPLALLKAELSVGWYPCEEARAKERWPVSIGALRIVLR